MAIWKNHKRTCETTRKNTAIVELAGQLEGLKLGKKRPAPPRARSHPRSLRCRIEGAEEEESPVHVVAYKHLLRFNICNK